MPAAIVEPFGALVGRWRGEGSFSPSPGEPARSWTATTEARWILDGRFVQEDTVVDLGAANPLQSRTIFGWDDREDRFVAMSVDNTGRAELVEAHWSTPDTLVAFTTEAVAGPPVFVRSIWEFGEGGYAYRVERASGGGPWHRLVEGRFKAVDEALPGTAETAFGAVGAEMARLSAVVGAYSVEGDQVGSGGHVLMTFHGQDEFRSMYGGHVLAANMTLEAPGRSREGHRYLAWDPDEGRYQVFSIDSLGGVGATQLRWDGEDWLVGESLAEDGDEGVLGSTLVTIGTAGLRRVTTTTVRADGASLGRVELRYRKTEEKK